MLYKQWIICSMDYFLAWPVARTYFYIIIDILFKSVTSNFAVHFVLFTTQSHMVKTWEKFVTSQNNGLNHGNYVMSLYLESLTFDDSYC